MDAAAAAADAEAEMMCGVSSIIRGVSPNILC